MQNPVGWFEIYVDDMQRAKTFYEVVLQKTLEHLPDPTGSGVELRTFPSDMESYGAAGALVKMEGLDMKGTGTLVYFSCEDCALEAHRVLAAGGQLHQDKMPIGEHGYIAIMIDTEGNMVGLHSMQ